MTVTDLQVVGDGETAAAMLHPTRLRILRALAEPDSAAGLARRLGEPRQRLGYHLRQLEAAGLVELVEERRRGNCTERVVRASAPAYVVDPAVLGPVAAHPGRARHGLPVSYLVAVLTRGVRELAKLRRLAGRAGKRLPVLTLDTEVTFASPEAQARFAEELSTAVSEVVARHHAGDAAGGRRFRLVVGAYPIPPEAEGGEPGADGADAAPSDTSDPSDPTDASTPRTSDAFDTSDPSDPTDASDTSDPHPDADEEAEA
ncbi:MAG TPA: helix-turn-helix domain-containing protein [Acidimicrobiales bacterium]